MKLAHKLLFLSVFFLINLNLFAISNSEPELLPEEYSEENLNTLTIPDYNPLLTYIQFYDIFKDRVFPLPPRQFYEGEDLGYPKMSPLFMPLVLNYIQRDLKIQKTYNSESSYKITSNYVDSLMNRIFLDIYTMKLTKNILLNAEKELLAIIEYDKKELPEFEELIFYINGKKPSTTPKVAPQVKMTDANTKIFARTEYRPWNKKGNSKLQFSQTYISPNWSKGGESNTAGLASIYLQANYNNLKNVQFDNNFEIKVGMNTVNSDTLRNFNISTDQIRAVSKLGIKMYNNWFYSLSGEFLTQMLNNYKKNTMTLKSSLLSPAKLFVSLGVDFKKSDNKKGYNLSVLLSPVTYKMNYLLDNVNLPTGSYGIETGKHFGHEIGSKISSTLSWKITDRIIWNSKIYYFTDFTYNDSEWENTFNLSLNNYLTTQFFVHLKIDDRLKRNPGEPLLQAQQLLSFGLAYWW